MEIAIRYLPLHYFPSIINQFTSFCRWSKRFTIYSSIWLWTFLRTSYFSRQLTSSDFGISTGLINQNYWENSKWYYVNVERGNAADKLNGRNINVSFTNNSNVPIEVMVFIFYSDEIAFDVKTGLVTRHKN
jgi:hypothetical protein